MEGDCTADNCLHLQLSDTSNEFGRFGFVVPDHPLYTADPIAVAVAMSWVISLAKLTSPNFRSLAKSTNAVQVVTIGNSHFCDLAIWCLKAKGIPYQEHDYTVVQHVLPALSVRMGGKTRYLSASSRVTPVVSPNLSEAEAAARLAKEARRDRSARATALPVAVCPNGDVWLDSWDIATKSGLPDIDPQLKKLLDERIAVLSRQLAFSFILQPRNANIWDALLTFNSGMLWKFLCNVYVRKFATERLGATMRPFDTAAVAECRTKLEAALKEVDQIIAAKKTPFLGGATIGVADIAVASLVAPLVNPPKYCGGRYNKILQQLMDQEPELQVEVERLRATPTGVFVMDMYAKHR